MNVVHCISNASRGKKKKVDKNLGRLLALIGRDQKYLTLRLRQEHSGQRPIDRRFQTVSSVTRRPGVHDLETGRYVNADLV